MRTDQDKTRVSGATGETRAVMVRGLSRESKPFHHFATLTVGSAEQPPEAVEVLCAVEGAGHESITLTMNPDSVKRLVSQLLTWAATREDLSVVLTELLEQWELTADQRLSLINAVSSPCRS